MATWEDEDDSLRRFPQFMAWGQAVANWGGDVMLRHVDSLPVKKKPKEKRERKPNTKYSDLEWGK
jgi:hypothetical protein